MSTKRIRELLFLRKTKVLMVPKTGTPSVGVIGAMLAELSGLGYTLSPSVVQILGTYSDEDITRWYKDELKSFIATARGAQDYRPMYPNFPRQVMQASDEELFLNAFIHYFGVAVLGMNILPDYKKDPRQKLTEKLPKLQVIEFGTVQEDVIDMFTDVLSMNTSPSAAEYKVLDAIEDVRQTLVVTIRNKETLAIVCADLLKGKKLLQSHFLEQLSTATDVLRTLSVLSAGPEAASLASNVKFKSFSRSIRRHVLGVLNSISTTQLVEDMMRYRQKWVRIGERLHPGEYTQFGNVTEAFKIIRNSAVGLTIASAIEVNKKDRNWRQVADLLSKRPGTFVRSLDEILRKAPAADHNYILHKFSNVAPEVGANVLWQAYGHFIKETRTGIQYYYPKGATTKAKLINKYIPTLAKGLYTDLRLILKNALSYQYSQRDTPFGDASEVYIDPICWSLKIPSFTRTISDTSGRVIGRGSRFSAGDKNIIRLFVWWANQDHPENGWGSEGRVDLDLTAVMFDRNLSFLTQCSWTNLRTGTGSFVHSGDITDAPRPAGGSEFLDINKDLVKSGHPNAAYIIPYVVSFTGQHMNTVDNVMGWMDRESSQRGEIYEPRTVKTAFSVTADATMSVPFIYDIHNNEIIWVDLDAGGNGGGRFANNSTYERLSTLCDAVLARSNAYIGDVFEAFAQAKGLTLVDEPTETSFNITEDGHMSPYNMAKFFNEYM